MQRVVAFGGQSLQGPPDSACFLELGAAAFDFDVSSKERMPAGGRCMGLAFRQGKGRVVITGEAGMLSAQLIESVWGGKFVTSDVVTVAVYALRQAFGDNAREPRSSRRCAAAVADDLPCYDVGGFRASCG